LTPAAQEQHLLINHFISDGIRPPYNYERLAEHDAGGMQKRLSNKQHSPPDDR